jgi:ribonuclease D
VLKSDTKIKGGMAIELHEGDLPDGARFGSAVAVDTETMGLNPHRDRLCVVQLSGGNGDCTIVRLRKGQYEAPRLKALLTDPAVTKIFHFARFDVAAIRHFLGVSAGPIYCTKIASRLARTFTDRHGLKDLCKDLLGVELSKEQQTSDWGAAELTPAQLKYAASDVLHLHALRNKLDELLVREGRRELAEACFRFLPTRAELDLAGWPDVDIFAH